jgi:hypothetical protein
MKSERTWAALGAALVLVVGGGWLAPAARAQSRSKATIDKVDVQRDLRTPDYRGVTTDPRAKSTETWMRFLLEYKTTGGTGRDFEGKTGWQDDVVVEWNILIRRKDQKDILMRRKVTYVDVQDSRGTHYADLYLRPGFINRNFKRVSRSDVDVYVQIRIGGRTEATYRTDRGTARWWESEPPRVEIYDSELQTRDQTPFAPLDYDFYEQLKPKVTAE